MEHDLLFATERYMTRVAAHSITAYWWEIIFIIILSFFFLHNWILKFFCLKNRLGDFLKSIWVLFKTSRFLSRSSDRLGTKSCRNS